MSWVQVPQNLILPFIPFRVAELSYKSVARVDVVDFNPSSQKLLTTCSGVSYMPQKLWQSSRIKEKKWCSQLITGCISYFPLKVRPQRLKRWRMAICHIFIKLNILNCIHVINVWMQSYSSSFSPFHQLLFLNSEDMLLAADVVLVWNSNLCIILKAYMLQKTKFDAVFVLE